MANPVTKKLLCDLTDEEADERGRQAAALDQEKRALETERRNKATLFREQLKHMDQQIAELTKQATTKQELREIACEERPGIVNGTIEVVRLDTMQVVETISEDPEDDAPENPNQPSLFDGRTSPAPKVPKLVEEAIDEDGECYAISKEQGDAIRTKLQGLGVDGHVDVEIDGHKRQIVRVRPLAATSSKGTVIAIDVAGVEHEIPNLVAVRLRESNRRGLPAYWRPKDADADVELAWVKGDPLRGIDGEGKTWDLTPEQVGWVREARAKKSSIHIHVGKDAIEIVRFEGELTTEDDARRIREGAPPHDDAPLPKRGRKKRNGQASATSEAE